MRLIDNERPQPVFVPEWGWVGSVEEKLYGMSEQKIFVPAWGWVGSRMCKCVYCGATLFSSPLGDGLVLLLLVDVFGVEMVFVPAWGWVGSVWVGWMIRGESVFVPAWGWVGSLTYKIMIKGY